MNLRILVLIALMASSCIGTHASARDTSSSRTLNSSERSALFPSEADLEQGKAIASANCASCHGMDGVSTEAGRPHLASQRTIYMYRELQAFQANLRADDSMHQAVKYLGDDTLLKSAIYYASLDAPEPVAPADEGWMQNDDPLASIRAATAGCGSCHGATGNSNVPGMPSLTSQHPQYFVTAMQSYQSGERSHNLMQMLTANLDDQVLADMGLFYALQTPETTPFATETDLAAGRSLTESCASCHGADGNATGSDMPSIAGQDPGYLSLTLKLYRNGQRRHEAMVNAMAGFSDSELATMVSYYSSQKPVARRVQAPLDTSQWLSRCQRCHGRNGVSTDPRYPSLAGQDEAYLVKAIGAYASSERVSSLMNAMTKPLSSRDIERLAKYYAARENKTVIYVDLPCVD